MYVKDSIMPRNNLDPKRTNKSGKYLLDLCKETGLRILNGRKVGDLSGKPTCIRYNGCSVVDYMLVSNELYSLIGYFEVHNFSSLSDHCPISCSLFTTFFVSKTSSLKLESLPAKFVWNKESVDTYTKQLTIKESQAYDYLDSNNLISINQIGFKPKCRTSDHILKLYCRYLYTRPCMINHIWGLKQL